MMIEYYQIIYWNSKSMMLISAEKKAIKGILLGIFLGFLIQFPGYITFLNYPVLIFEKSGASSMDPYLSSIMLAIAQIIGGLISGKLADSIGRRLLMIISFLGL